MKNPIRKIYQYGISRLKLQEKNIAFKVLRKYRSFCKDIILKKPGASLLYLSTSAFLALQFYIDYPTKELPEINFMKYD
jgi:hypothetical protein